MFLEWINDLSNCVMRMPESQGQGSWDGETFILLQLIIHYSLTSSVLNIIGDYSLMSQKQIIRVAQEETVRIRKY